MRQAIDIFAFRVYIPIRVAVDLPCAQGRPLMQKLRSRRWLFIFKRLGSARVSKDKKKHKVYI